MKDGLTTETDQPKVSVERRKVADKELKERHTRKKEKKRKVRTDRNREAIIRNTEQEEKQRGKP